MPVEPAVDPLGEDDAPWSSPVLSDASRPRNRGEAQKAPALLLWTTTSTRSATSISALQQLPGEDAAAAVDRMDEAGERGLLAVAEAEPSRRQRLEGLDGGV